MMAVGEQRFDLFQKRGKKLFGLGDFLMPVLNQVQFFHQNLLGEQGLVKVQTLLLGYGQIVPDGFAVIAQSSGNVTDGLAGITPTNDFPDVHNCDPFVSHLFPPDSVIIVSGVKDSMNNGQVGNKFDPRNWGMNLALTPLKLGN